MRFADRIDAAEHLAQPLQAWRGRHPLVLAIATPDFDAVGQFYRTFGQVDDEEAIALLRGAGQGAPSSP